MIERLEWRSIIEMKTTSASSGHETLERAREGLRRFIVAAGIPVGTRRFRRRKYLNAGTTTARSEHSRDICYRNRWSYPPARAAHCSESSDKHKELITAAGISDPQFVWKLDDVQYLYPAFDELKQSGLAEATHNARDRARVMAQALNPKLGDVRQISFGDIEIRSSNS